MKKLVLLLAWVLAVGIGAQAQQKGKEYVAYAVGFYNQENLFDTQHDEGKNDYEFLPNGSYKWNDMKYDHKLNNMSKVLAEMGTDMLPKVGCAVIGLSEVENDHVLNDLTAKAPLKARGYKYVHIEGPDKRGIDCALLYNPSLFEVTGSELIPYVQTLAKDSAYKTRGFLTVTGKLAGEDFAFIVCHWPSRFSGSFYREQAGKQVRNIKDNLLEKHPGIKVVVMGDMNDDPTNKSMYEALGAKESVEKTGKGDMYNPWYNILVKQGKGTLSYKGSWNLFDQIVMTPNMLNTKGKKDFSSLKFFKNEIFHRDYLFQTDGPYKGIPKRTTAGGVWLDGYSDHLPVVVYLVKEKK